MSALLNKYSAVSRVALVTVLVYFTSSVLNTYRTLFFMDIGLTATQIGWISAAGPIATLAFQTQWGKLGDRFGRKAVVLCTLAGMGGVALLYLLNRDFLFVLGVTVLSTLFVIGTDPLTDSMGMDFCIRNGFRYGPMRMMGTIGYTLAPLVWGWLFDRDLRMVFPIYALMSGITMLCVAIMPADYRAPRTKGGKVKSPSLLPRLRDRKVLFVLAAALIMALSSNITGYFSVLARGVGLENSTIGLFSSISTCSEIPMLLIIDRLMNKLGREKIMVAGVFFSAVRLSLYYFGANCGSAVLMLGLFGLGQAMQSVTFISCSYCCMNLLYSRFPDNQKASGQTLLSLMQMGVGRIVGSLVGGYLCDALGAPQTFGFMSIVIALLSTGLLIFALYNHRHPQALPLDTAA